MHLSETAFAHPLTDDADADWALRWFTPEVETNLCGHATLATAHAMHRDRGAPGTVRFMSHSGVLVAHTADDGTITLDFPAAPATEVAAPEGLPGGARRDCRRRPTRPAPSATCCASSRTRPAVRTLAPDLSAIADIARRDGIRGIDRHRGSADPQRGYDFVSRFFAPADGIPEDPVTGSAHTALAPYWSSRLGRDGLTGLQASARGGLVRTSIHGDRVHLTGHAVVVVDGTLTAS